MPFGLCLHVWERDAQADYLLKREGAVLTTSMQSRFVGIVIEKRMNFRRFLLLVSENGDIILCSEIFWKE